MYIMIAPSITYAGRNYRIIIQARGRHLIKKSFNSHSSLVREAKLFVFADRKLQTSILFETIIYIWQKVLMKNV